MATKMTDGPAAEAQHDLPTPHSNRFFEWIRALDIPRRLGWIGGVCAGLGARLGIDPLIVRGIVVVLAIFGAPVVLLYAAAWLLLPDATGRIHLEQLARGNPQPALIGIGVLGLLVLLPVGILFTPNLSIFGGLTSWLPFSGLGSLLLKVFWTLLVLGLIVAFIVWMVRYTRRHEQRAYPYLPAQPGYAPATASDANAAQAQSDAIPESATAPTPPPAAPPADAGAEELAAWREQQALWKREHDAWKQQQAESQRAMLKARADEQRRLHQEQHAAWQRERRTKRRQTRSNPLFTLTAVGAALVAGAAVMLMVGAERWTSVAAITGMAVTLGVLGLAIMVNGFLGRRSGGSSGLAVLVSIALITTTALSGVGGLLGPREIVNWTPTASINGSGFGYSQHRIIANGDVTLDLRDYYGAAASDVDSGALRLTVGTGSVHVILPAGEYGAVQAHSALGTVRYLGDQPAVDHGPFANDYRTYGPDGVDRDWSGTNPKRTYYVTIMLGIGDIVIEQPATAKEPS